MADWDVIGHAPAQLQNPWAVRSMAPAPAVPGDIGSAKQGLAGQPAAPVDQTGQANAAAGAHEQGPVQDVIDMIRAAPSGIIPALKGILGQVEDPLGSVAKLAQSVRSVISNPDAALAAVKNATPQQVGKNVLAPAIAGAGVNELGGAAAGLGDTTGAAAAEAASPAGQLGLRSTQGRPIATTLAGPSAGPTLAAQNQAAAETVLGADAGVPHGVGVNPTSLEAARTAPGRVLDEGAASLPTAPLSPAAAAKVTAARGPATITKPTPNVANQINDIESSLLEPGAQFSGAQIRATRNSLSSDANAGMNSADADTRAIAQYKRNVVDALDQHVADTMPPNSAISPDMIANARATLAKNYNLQDLIGKGGDINLQALAKMHRESPNLLTGNTRTVAQFASDHPEVTGGITNANRIAPPSLGTDLTHVNIINPRSWVQPIFGALGRNSLTGGNPLAAAEQAPVAGLAGEFDHRPLALGPGPGAVGPPPPRQQGLPLGEGSGQVVNPTGGVTASPPAAPPPTAAGPPGQIPLADLLSHGVEQPPAPGLSVAPMGAPAQAGIPFRPNLEHAAGGLTLDELLGGPRTYGGSNADVAAVRSANVPDNIAARAAQTRALGPEDFVNQNASGESVASLEDQHTPKGNLVQFGPDDVPKTIMKSAGQKDVNPDPHHIIIDTDTNEIVKSGGMAPRLAQGLLARWKALHGTPLGSAYE
jgi:hypothetical protein